MNRLSAFATNFFYTGLGLYEDEFIDDAQQVIVEENLEWPEYRRLIVTQYALKIIFALGVILTAAISKAFVASWDRNWKVNLERGVGVCVAIACFILIWVMVYAINKKKIQSSFVKILMSIPSGHASRVALLDCLKKHGAHILWLNLTVDCSDQEQKELCITDEELEEVIEVSPNITYLNIDANQLTQKGFDSICTVANTLFTLHLKAAHLNRGTLTQFCNTVHSSPSTLGFYSSNLCPADFCMLFRKFGRQINAIEFKYEPTQKQEVIQLVRWLDGNFGRCGGEWCYYPEEEKGTCKVHFLEDDSDSDDD